jgi:hypothetical protein
MRGSGAGGLIKSHFQWRGAAANLFEPQPKRKTEMKVRLRRINTREYYAGAQLWTPDEGKAVDFRNVEFAIKTGRDEELTGLEVVLSFEAGGEGPVVRFPLSQ